MKFSRSSPCFVAFALIICINHVFSESEGEGSYANHCSSVIPPYNATARSYGGSLPSLTTSLFSGGDWFERMEPDGIHNRAGQDLRLRLLPVHYLTTATGVYKVEGFLYFSLSYRPDDIPDYRTTAGGDFRFPMNGLWSEKSRTLCMVGSTSLKAIDVGAVLKLKFDDEENPTIHTGVVSGSFESTTAAGDPAYFDPILIFSFPETPNYRYSLVSDGNGAGFPSRESDSLSLDSAVFCLVMERCLSTMEMEYAAECEERPPPRRCSPLQFLSNYLSLSSIQCEERSRKARFRATFGNYSGTGSNNFPAGSTAVGEAWWDDKSNRINGVACLILNPSLQLGNAVSDCTIRLSLNHPSVLTLRNDARIVGAIWSSRASGEDSGYFRRINLTITDDGYDVVVYQRPDQRYSYKYTELDRARKLCSRQNKTAEKTKTKPKAKGDDGYREGKSDDMRFDLNIKDGNGQNLAWAIATPAWVENVPFKTGTDSPYAESEAIAQLLKLEPARITYIITMHPSYAYDPNANSTPNLNWPVPYPSNGLVITAEGLYDGETGHLCMVGCRKLIPPNSASAFKDCEIVVEVEMPVLGRESGGLVKGIIRSTRQQTDPLHFDDMMMESTAYDQGEAERSVWRMDIEIAMVVTSNALVSIFVALQIFHLKRNPEAVSSVSLVMVLILCAGHMIPLVLNFELAGYAGRLEVNEVAVRLISMVTLLLQLRLLQLVYAALKQRKNSWWSGEIMAGFVSFSLYVIGGLLTLVLRKTHDDDGMHSIWSDLRCYGGLILDGFLLPQILLNAVKGSSSGEKALCRSFYVGTSAVRLVPHVYNQYRYHNYPEYDLYSTYYYANPRAELYSTAWDIAIPCGIVAFAVIVFLQQRNSGRCFLPQRFEKSGYT